MCDTRLSAQCAQSLRLEAVRAMPPSRAATLVGGLAALVQIKAISINDFSLTTQRIIAVQHFSQNFDVRIAHSFENVSDGLRIGFAAQVRSIRAWLCKVAHLD